MSRTPSALRVVDVAVWYGARSGGIRTYLDAKAQFAMASGAFEHHLVIPAATERHTDGRHELPGVLVERANGYRLPADARPLLRSLRSIRPDVVLLHDPHWWPATAVRCARELGATVVAVHHGSAAAGAIAQPGPAVGWRRALSSWQRRLYRRVDAVMMASAAPPEAENIRAIPLRFGIDPAFRPRVDTRRGPHVLYAGRLSPEKGIDVLLHAMVDTESAWPLRLVGCGPAERRLRRQAARLGLAERTRFAPFINDPATLSREYAQARCVVVPGSHETFGLVAIEAAASGASVAASTAVPSTRLAGDLIRTFPDGDARALARAIDDADDTTPSELAAIRFARRHSWSCAFEAELADFRALRG